MSFKALLRSVAEKTAPGRAPSYGEAQVLRTLEIVSVAPIGRAALGAKLGVGEGVVRTITKRLIVEKLLEVSSKGISISKKGQRILNEAHSVISSGAEAPATDDTVGASNYAIIVKSGSAKIRRGLEQRDAALLAGAKGATTITRERGTLIIPGMDRAPSEALRSFVEKCFRVEDGDAVVIGTGDTAVEAEIGAYAAALSLV